MRSWLLLVACASLGCSDVLGYDFDRAHGKESSAPKEVKDNTTPALFDEPDAGPDAYQSCPVRTPSPMLRAASGYTCRLDGQGQVLCWGSYLGTLRPAASTPLGQGMKPVALFEDKAMSIAAGETHTCIIDLGGSVHCRGENGSGQLGDGTRSDRSTAVRVDLPGPARQVTAGRGFTCAALENGAVYAWGEARFAGIETTRDPTRPTRMDLPPVREVAAGSAHACALTQDGRVFCWGINGPGVLGRPPAEDASQDTLAPVLVEDLPGDVDKIASGAASSCIATHAGEIHCWGRVAGKAGTPPKRIEGVTDAVALSLLQHACAVTSVGTVLCWGQNAQGAIAGADAGTMIESPVRVGPTTDRLIDVSVGYFHTCAMADTLAVFCWGANSMGQLGQPGGETAEPVLVLEAVR